MWWQATLAVLAVLMALLAVPVDVSCRASSVGVAPVRLRVRWLFGLLRVERSLPGAAKARAPTAARAPRRRRKRARRGVASIGKRALLRRALRLLGRLLRRVRILHLGARLRIGLDDPADTGILMGALLPLAVVVPRVRDGLTVVPQFAGECFEADGDVEIRVIPLRLIAPAVSFAAWFGVQALRARKRS